MQMLGDFLVVIAEQVIGMILLATNELMVASRLRRFTWLVAPIASIAKSILVWYRVPSK